MKRKPRLPNTNHLLSSINGLNTIPEELVFLMAADLLDKQQRFLLTKSMAVYPGAFQVYSDICALSRAQTRKEHNQICAILNRGDVQYESTNQHVFPNTGIQANTFWERFFVWKKRFNK